MVRRVRSQGELIQTGEFQQPEFFKFARFYKGNPITVRFLGSGFFLAARNTVISTVSAGKRVGFFFGSLLLEVLET